jgi:thiamine pyrophosphate-dependent acetolactate synthase large subunit-like protein
MSGNPAYRALAEAFFVEGVDTQFVLTGDGNMHWATALAQMGGVQSVHVRHEHCAVAAATAYAIASAKVGVASVTCGPGLTQIITALPAAVRARVPLVVFAGEAPLHAGFYNQEIDQAPIVAATGARYIRAHSMRRMLDQVREAFHVAQAELCPVVLGVPYDLQKETLPQGPAYVPSARLLPDGGRPQPDPRRVSEVVDRILAARLPIMIGGRGVLRSGAKDAIVALADRAGALLSNTLPVRGLFDDHAFSLGVVGGYSSDLARNLFEQSDLVIALGTSLSYYSKDGGKLFPNAFVVQIDLAPKGLKHGMSAADLYVSCDAQAGARVILAALDDRLTPDGQAPSQARSSELKDRIRRASPDQAEFDIVPGQLDPRAFIAALDRVVPKDWDVVSGSGHQAYFNSQMRGRPAERFLTVREFGAIGNGLSYALGVAAARRYRADGKLVLIEGDGGLIMHVQELETIRRLGLRVLICVMNDGAYGSEIHKLRADGLDDGLAKFGRTSFDSIARGFGLRGVEVTDLRGLSDLFERFSAQEQSEVWNVQVSDQVTAPPMRKLIARGHGVM